MHCTSTHTHKVQIRYSYSLQKYGTYIFISNWIRYTAFCRWNGTVIRFWHRKHVERKFTGSKFFRLLCFFSLLFDIEGKDNGNGCVQKWAERSNLIHLLGRSLLFVYRSKTCKNFLPSISNLWSTFRSISLASLLGD